MRHVFWVVVLAGLVASAKDRGKKPNVDKHDAVGTIVLNDEVTEVRWTDGDSFKVGSGPYKGRGTRLKGYNTLEAYGPVHRWGEWTTVELYAIAKDASTIAAAHQWACTTDGKEDAYKRLLIDCPDLAVDIVKQGYALAYAVEGKAAPAVLEAQREAQTAQRGMWKKGVVKGVITSLHSLGEDGDEAEVTAYNRVVDTRTGEASKRKHDQKYASCQEVCELTDGDQSCMIYVPFKHRYSQRPSCLFTDH